MITEEIGPDGKRMPSWFRSLGGPKSLVLHVLCEAKETEVCAVRFSRAQGWGVGGEQKRFWQDWLSLQTLPSPQPRAERLCGAETTHFQDV